MSKILELRLKWFSFEFVKSKQQKVTFWQTVVVIVVVVQVEAVDSRGRDGERLLEAFVQLTSPGDRRLHGKETCSGRNLRHPGRRCRLVCYQSCRRCCCCESRWLVISNFQLSSFWIKKAQWTHKIFKTKPLIPLKIEYSRGDKLASYFLLLQPSWISEDPWIRICVLLGLGWEFELEFHSFFFRVPPLRVGWWRIWGHQGRKNFGPFWVRKGLWGIGNSLQL